MSVDLLFVFMLVLVHVMLVGGAALLIDLSRAKDFEATKKALISRLQSSVFKAQLPKKEDGRQRPPHHLLQPYSKKSKRHVGENTVTCWPNGY